MRHNYSKSTINEITWMQSHEVTRQQAAKKITLIFQQHRALTKILHPFFITNKHFNLKKEKTFLDYYDCFIFKGQPYCGISNVCFDPIQTSIYLLHWPSINFFLGFTNKLPGDYIENIVCMLIVSASKVKQYKEIARSHLSCSDYDDEEKQQ